MTRPEERPFRFGVTLDASEGRRDRVLEIAQRAEAAGASVLLGVDHLGSWGALPRLVTAAQFTGLRIGTLVLNNDLRHPPVLAQELAAVDAMTDGRLEIGLGAGWNRPEYEAAGLTFDPPGERLRRMQASLRMLRQALSEGRIDHDADDAYPAIHQQALPTSVQRPHPPFLVGGGGPKLLAFAAREADIIGIDPRSLPGGGPDVTDITEAAVDRKIGWIREAAGERWAAAGDQHHRLAARPRLPPPNRCAAAADAGYLRGGAAAQPALPRGRRGRDGRHAARPPRAVGHQLRQLRLT